MSVLRDLFVWLALLLAAAPASAGTSLGGDFTLTTAAGDAVSLASLRGKVVLIDFDFTRCLRVPRAGLFRRSDAVRFRQVPTGSGYTVDHTVNTYLVDPAGRLVRILPPGTPAEAMLGAVVEYLP